MLSRFIFLSLVALSSVVLVDAVDLVDATDKCEEWARVGECDSNPRYMRTNCKKSCHEYDMAIYQDEFYARADDAYNNFFDLHAKDIDGNKVDFSKFRGTTTVIVNVASHCGYTESHYNGLVALDRELKSDKRFGGILAFPCNQFGNQESDKCPVIKRFAEQKGVEFTMMDKIEVNGPKAHPVYKYLKKNAGPRTIAWNFATYFVISPSGLVASHSGVEPLDLIPHIHKHMSEEL